LALALQVFTNIEMKEEINKTNNQLNLFD
jgi:hypothetical protein